jgi:hypothetical protein
MPRYTFQIHAGGQPQPSFVSDRPDNDATQSEATAMFADMARGTADDLPTNPKWQIKVADETGKPIFRLSVIAETLK